MQVTTVDISPYTDDGWIVGNVNEEGKKIDAWHRGMDEEREGTNPLEVISAEGGHAHPLDGGAEPASIVCSRVVQQCTGQESPQECTEQPTIGEHGA